MNTMPMSAFEADQGPMHPAKDARDVEEVNVEENFGVDELFFSRTDTRGVIEAYNEIFVRVAGYSGNELQGAPHKIVRHSDMPKAVFWLLWNGLQQGVPVGAYVKNRTKEGKYYWVFAMASPVKDGHLSVRMKPTSDLLPKVEALYADLLHAEQTEALSPEDSAARLLAQLAELGFPTYAMFQSHAIYQEFESRRTKLRRPRCRDLSNTATISKNADTLRHELAYLSERFEEAALLTANMKVFAAKLSEGRTTINEIATNYDLMLRDIKSHLRTLDVTEDFDGIWDVSRDQNSFFMLCASHLMEELCETFQKEGCVGGRSSKEEETHILNRLRNEYNRQSMAAVVDGIQSAVAIRRKTEFLKRMILGLSTARIACRVEAGTLKNTAKGLDNIVSRLDEFHEDVESHLAKVQIAVNAILKGVDRSMTVGLNLE